MTTPNQEDPPIGAVRERVRDRAEQTSIRWVAEEIGLGHSTVHNFLNGAAPHPRGRRKLLAWYALWGAPDQGAGAARDALNALTSGLPDAYRARTQTAIVEVVEQAHFAAGNADVPAWVRALGRVGAERREQ
jgi:hypothetical protein